MRAMARWAAILAGGVFSLSAASLPKTYQHDVQPILERRCVTCHQAGEIAPMAFTSYAQVRPWASAIREALLSHKMPPWHAAPGTAHAFRNDRSLNKDEVDSIVAWVGAEGLETRKTGHGHSSPRFSSTENRAGAVHIPDSSETL